MKFFYWNANFEIGIPQIDMQHRRLVDMINALAAVIADGSKLPEAEALISRLIEYAAVHFADEERLMETAPLPEEEKALHRQVHRSFVEKVETVFRRPDLQEAEVAEQVLEFLTTWLISHILRSDMKIGAALVPGRPQGEPRTSLLDVSPVERVLIGALSETERRFRLISDHAPALIWVSDSAGSRGFVNRAWLDYVGLDEDEARDIDWFDFVHPDDRAAYRALVERTIAQPVPAEAEYRLRHGSGAYGWILERILPRIDSGGVFVGLIASATDISAIKQAEALLSQSNLELEQEVARRTAQLEQLMLTDPLTGIGNRRFLTVRLEDEIVRARRYGRPLTAAFFDIDHFKRVNDTYGHAVGDAVLVRVAASLKAGLRECDVLGRFGGEEFVVLLIETGANEAVALAERLRTAISGLVMPEMAQPITISAGLAELRPEEDSHALLARSDRALYRAKADGRDRCQLD
jgi:diguanylate cyclase (GGDEF)-like protein/hemerythrin-like metal-binding protein/PAS domain S-box-containing protein